MGKINCIVNAIFIFKIIEDGLNINEFDYLYDFFNNLDKRDQIYSDFLLYWIHDAMHHYPPNLKLVLPKLKPNNLIFVIKFFPNINKKFFKELIKKNYLIRILTMLLIVQLQSLK